MNLDIKTINTTFQALSDLAKSQGYLYVLLFVIEEDIFVPISQIKESNPRTRISVKEAAMLLGLIVKGNPNILDEPKDIHSFFKLRKETYQLLNDLHRAMNEPIAQEMRDVMERIEKGEIPNFPSKENMANAKFQREAFFYSNEPAYDLEYLLLAPIKYQYDKEWLLENKGFEIEDVIRIVINIKSEFNERIKNLPYFSKEKMEDIILKDNHLKNDLQAIEKALNICALYRYEGLLSTDLEADKDKDYIDAVNCHDLCQVLLNLFSLNYEGNKTQIGYQSFLNNFSLELCGGVNKNYAEPGANNIVYWKPIIKIDSHRYILPLPYLLFQSIYESPYYWFLEKETYLKKARSHMGTSSEDMVYSFLNPIFGGSRIFKNVIVKSGKKEITDIDVLCLLGNKALCIQVKSKKLTESAQIGNDESYKKDFKGAISDAYKQGVLCRDSILSQKCKFYTDNGQELEMKSIDDVYILCVTTGFYPAIPQQVRLLLNLKEEDPTPVVVNIFDLHIISHYLKDPYDFLYYIRQRIATNDYYIAENESILLSYHLTQKLWKDIKYNTQYLDQTIAEKIDEDYGNIFNLTPDDLKDNNSLTCNWISYQFRLFLLEIKNCRNPNITDIIFDLYDCSNESERILSMIDAARARSIRNHSIVSMCIVFEEGKFGITYTASFSNNTDDLFNQMNAYVQSHKYKSKGDRWVGFACCTDHPNMIDLLMYDKNPWVRDEEIETGIRVLESLNNKVSAEISAKKKIGRNELCPCGSGLKYKNCHGKY